MKIIYIANVRLPTEKAHGIQIMKMCEEFKKAGQDITLVVSSRGEGDPFEFYGIETMFPIERIKVPDLTGKIPWFGFFIDYLVFGLRARKFLKRQNFDIIYTRGHPFFLKFLEEWRNKIVFEFHHLYSSLKFCLKDLKGIKAIITITKAIKNDLVKLGIDENKIFVAPDGVDLKEFEIPNYSKNDLRGKLGLPKDKKIALYAGSLYLYDWKGVDILMEAAKFLGEEAMVCLVGGTEKEISNLKSLPDRQAGQISNLLTKILVIGRRPHKEIPYWLKAADVLVLPNKKGNEISEKYTSPLKLFEYMASGNPIVASDLPSIREILNENNAVLVESNNAEALATGVKKILQNPVLVDEISKQALLGVQNYTWRKRAEKILDFIF